MFSAEYEQDPSCGMSDCQYQHCPAYYEEHPYVYQYAQHYTLHVQNNERFSDSNKTLDQRLSSLESGLGSLRGEILQAVKNLERKTVNRSRSPSNSPVRDPPSSPTRNHQQTSVQQYAQQQTVPQYVQQPSVQQYAQPCTQSYMNHEQTSESSSEQKSPIPQYPQQLVQQPISPLHMQHNVEKHQAPVYTQSAPAYFQQAQQQCTQPQQALPNIFQPPFVQGDMTLESLEVFVCESDPEELEDENSSLSQVCDQESGTQHDSTYEKSGVDHHAPKQTYNYSKEDIDIFLKCIMSMGKREQHWHSLESSKQADSKTPYPLKNQAVHMQQLHSDKEASAELGLPSQLDVKEISCANRECNVTTGTGRSGPMMYTTPSPVEQVSEYAGVMATSASPQIKLCTKDIEGKSRCDKVMPLPNLEETMSMRTAFQENGAGHNDDAFYPCYLMSESTGEMAIPAVPPIKLCIETKGEVGRDMKVLQVSTLKDTTELLADLSISVTESADGSHKLHEKIAESNREMYRTHIKISLYTWQCMHMQRQAYCVFHNYLKGLSAENKCWAIPWCWGFSDNDKLI